MILNGLMELFYHQVGQIGMDQNLVAKTIVLQWDGGIALVEDCNGAIHFAQIGIQDLLAKDLRVIMLKHSRLGAFMKQFCTDLFLSTI